MAVLVGGLIAFLVVGLFLYFISVYNGLVLLSRNIDKAWSNIDVLLKQRHDELPNLVRVCEGYMKHERQTLENVIAARNAGVNAKGIPEAAMAAGMLTQSLKSLFAVAENYPDLKANQNFLQLQNRVTTLENQIADRREFYNDSVNTYNIRIASIPDTWIAKGMLHYEDRALFKAEDSERTNVNIRFNEK